MARLPAVAGAWWEREGPANDGRRVAGYGERRPGSPVALPDRRAGNCPEAPTLRCRMLPKDLAPAPEREMSRVGGCGRDVCRWLGRRGATVAGPRGDRR